MLNNVPGSEHSLADSIGQDEIAFPPGDIGLLAKFIMDFAHYPNRTIALAGAIAIYAGIVAKGYQTPTGASPNVYILFLGPTGLGKDIVKLARAALFKSMAEDHNYPAIYKTVGPGEIASGQGLIRWWEQEPCCLSILGEFAPTLKKITDDKANPNDAGIKQKILMGYSSTVDPSAYADRDKNTKYIDRLAYSIFAESVPETIYESMGDSGILSGLLPRFDIFEDSSPRTYLSKTRIKAPPQELGKHLANVDAHAAANKIPVVPTFAEDAEAKLDEFERWVTDQINASQDEVSRHLWNRVNLKAQKLATLRAIGENREAPVITHDGVMWATNLQVRQTFKLIAKFKNNEVGAVEGNQSIQEQKILEVLNHYWQSSWPEIKKYHGTEAMHNKGAITLHYISKRLQTNVAFSKDRLGADASIKRTLKQLLENDIIKEIPPSQMIEMFGVKPRAFFSSNFKEIFGYEPSWPKF